MITRLSIALFILTSTFVGAQSTSTVYSESNPAFGNGANGFAQRPVKGNSGLSGSFAFMLSGGLNYLYGEGNSDNTFDFDYSGWDGELMFGYGYYYQSGDMSAMLGLFLRGGVSSYDSMQKIIADGGLNRIVADKPDNAFYNFEAGAVLRSFLRLSTGLGFQEYESEGGSISRLKYYSTTAGILIGSRNIKLSIHITMMYGRDLKQTLYKPGVSMALIL